MENRSPGNEVEASESTRLRLELARAERHLHELRGLFAECCRAQGQLCGALGFDADEPGEKLAARAARLVRQHRRLLDAAGAVCDCAQPSLGGNWFVLHREFVELQVAVDQAEGKEVGRGDAETRRT